jgi:mono/diheme cytochrome c family protein
MKKKIISIIMTGISASLFTQCYYDNEQVLYGEQKCSSDVSTYSGKVSSIIQSNCITCHSASVQSGGVTLETYQQIKTLADNGTLAGVITHSSGFFPMPKNAPQLSKCNIDAILQWIEAGSPNN